MEQFSQAIKCRLCKCILDSPVLLPCCHSVCKKHEKERKHIACYECDVEYEIPSGGFAEQKDLALIIASGIFQKVCEIDLGPEHKSAVKACKEMEKIIAEVEQLVKDPIFYVHERISELKMKIDLAREEFKWTIDEEAEVVLRKLQEYESECERNLKSIEILSTVNEIESELNAKKLDLDNWTRYLDNFKVDCKKFANIQNKCETEISQLNDDLESFQEIFLINKYRKYEQDVKDFEKIEICFHYKSSIEGKCYATNKNNESCLAVLRDGTLACGHSNGSITIWDPETLKTIRTLTGHTNLVNCVKELSDGNLASASDDKKIKIWLKNSDQLLRSLNSHIDEVWVLEQLSDGSLVSGSIDKTIKIWNVCTGDLLKSINIDENAFSLALFKESYLACVVETKLIIFDTRTWQIVRTLENDTFHRLLFLNNGNLVIGQTDTNITIWDVTSWKSLMTLKGHKREVNALKLLNNGCLASGSLDGEIKIWNPINGQFLKTIKVDDDQIYSIDQLSNGDLVTISNGCKFWK